MLFLEIRQSKLWIVHNVHNNKHPLRSSAEGYGCKTHKTDLEGQTFVALSGRTLTTEYGRAGITYGQYVVVLLSGFVDSTSKLHIQLDTQPELICINIQLMLARMTTS
jgi:hypothetical protein